MNLRASPPEGPDFIRGDCNDDGDLDVADAVNGLNILFGNTKTECEVSCDANDDDTFDISDSVYSLTHLFQMGSPPPEPFPGCGGDPTPGGITCGSFEACP